MAARRASGSSNGLDHPTGVAILPNGRLAVAGALFLMGSIYCCHMGREQRKQEALQRAFEGQRQQLTLLQAAQAPQNAQQASAAAAFLSSVASFG